jgi:hypothetical protein
VPLDAEGMIDYDAFDAEIMEREAAADAAKVTKAAAKDAAKAAKLAEAVAKPKAVPNGGQERLFAKQIQAMTHDERCVRVETLTAKWGAEWTEAFLTRTFPEIAASL